MTDLLTSVPVVAATALAAVVLLTLDMRRREAVRPAGAALGAHRWYGVVLLVVFVGLVVLRFVTLAH